MKIMLAGYNGKMGRAVIEAAHECHDLEIAAGTEITPPATVLPFPVFSKPSDYSGGLDVILDFTYHSETKIYLEYAKERKVPVIVASTGHTPEELEFIKSASEKVAVFKSANMSIGINLLAELAKKAAVILKDDFDIEIIEKHHNKKLDAPSGTALLLADEISSVLDDEYNYIYDRHNAKAPRSKREIGLHAIRGGTIIGEHEIIFAGPNELITLSHSAQSRGMFAAGALAAARFIIGKPCGLYGMSDMLKLQ